MNIQRQEPQKLELNFTDIMQYNNTEINIDWSKVFQEKTRTYFPQAINRNKCLNEEGEFDPYSFILSRSRNTNERKYYLEEIDKKLIYLDMINTIKNEEKFSQMQEIYELKSILKDIINQFKRAYFLGKDEEVYKQDFFVYLKDVLDQLEESRSLESNINVGDLYKTINKKTNEGLSREETKRKEYLKRIEQETKEMVDCYIREGNNLDVDKILKDLNSPGTRNHESMLFAFYTAKCSREDLSKLQDGVYIELENKLKNLDAHKFFTILERIFPYIYHGFSIKFELPEIFRPEYLSHISVYNLTPESFEAEVKIKGKEFNWSEEVQNKLIEQFKKFGQDKSGKIGFGQGSEKLRYRQQVTGAINPKNFDYYRQKEDLGLNKRPVPNILRDNEANYISEEIYKSLK